LHRQNPKTDANGRKSTQESESCYIHHMLAELSKAAAVLERGGVFDSTSEPKVGTPIAQRQVGGSAGSQVKSGAH
jgi:hypothetical protein